VGQGTGILDTESTEGTELPGKRNLWEGCGKWDLLSTVGRAETPIVVEPCEYEYDHENRIVKITKDSNDIAEFAYDALGTRRVGSVQLLSGLRLFDRSCHWAAVIFIRCHCFQY
jgi:hypothetical protein